MEPRWQREWKQRESFVAKNPGEPGFDASKPKFYCLDMFPYPSGAGLHIGHPEGYTATDILCRYKRAKGFNVLHPMGWDAFGLPAEQYAIQTGVHPAITTRASIENFRRQLQRFGFCYDWEREFGTIDESYYKWTQWIFLKLYGSWFDPTKNAARPIGELEAGLMSGVFDVSPDGGVVRLGDGERGARPPTSTSRWSGLGNGERGNVVDHHRLAYLAQTTVNWCPKLGTVLANDEVIDGRSERGGYPVLRKPMKQWMFRITAYAGRLLSQLNGLDWPSSTKAQQAEWMGKSEGAEVEFKIDVTVASGGASSLTVFTTRPDTLFGATYMVVAPEHELCEQVTRGELGVDAATVAALKNYCDRARNRGDVERQQDSKEKTGVFTGVYAVNPASEVRIPVWTADYVLMGYGTGAIMAVPAHDERDYEFAKAFDLPIRDVVYSSITCAMDYFARRASPDEQADDVWSAMLADMLGVTVSRSLPPSRLEEAINVVRHGRPKGVPVPPPDRRGSLRAEWLDMIETVGMKEFEDFRDVFLAASYHRASGGAFTQTGYAVNSSSKIGSGGVDINGLPTEHAKSAMISWLERAGVGRGKVNYRLRDWTFSRQRYWGEPFPIVYDAAGKAYPISASHLPVTLPELADYAPVESDTPQPLLAKATAWMHTTAGAAGVDPALLPPETLVTRETNTMPGSAGSSWYAIRYCDPKNSERLVGKEAEAYWMGPKNEVRGGSLGVDLYLGGSEHAVGHLLYSRFWQNVLYDLGEVSTPEPFHKLVHQGLITSFAYQRPDKTIVPVDEVKEVVDGEKVSYVEIATSKAVAPIVTKMSKRYKNVVNPDDVINEFGADTCRLYEMYMGPLETSKPWNPRDISGCHRFLQRAWRLCVDEKTGALRPIAASDASIEKLLHRTIAKVGADIERLAFNTAIAAMIEFVNASTTAGGLTTEQMSNFALVLGPFAPHMAEELWAKVGAASHAASGTANASLPRELLCDAAWATFDESMLRDDQVEIPVQIMGKVRGRVMVAAGADETAARAAVMADAKLVEAIGGKAIKKMIYVPGRMINLLVG